MKLPVIVIVLGACVGSSACAPDNAPHDAANAGARSGASPTLGGSGGRASSGGGAPSTVGGAGTGTGQAGTTSTPGGAGGNAGLGGAGTGGGGGNGGGTSGGNAGAGAELGGAASMMSLGGAGASPGGNGGTSAGASPGGNANRPVYHYGADVENTSTDCTVGTLADPSTLPKIQKLPNPFVRMDGTTLAKRSDWHCRRQEILKQAEKYIYGERPAFDKVSGSVTSSKISVHVEALGKSIDFSVNVKLPTTGEPPYPAIINVGASGISLGEPRILGEGVAILYYNMYDLGQEGTAEQSRGKPNPGKFYELYGGTHSAGLLQAWSWGASRLIDVIQEADGSIIDVGRLGVTGCSRNGKGAFAVGLWDERIALTIPHETSTAGVPAYRIVDILNTERTDHNYFGLNWLSDNFEPFVYEEATKTSNAVKLPIDTHSLIGTIAPRGLLVLENPHQTQMSAPAGHMASLLGSEVYKALGVEGHISYHSDVSQTPHCTYKDEYTELLLQNIGKFLKHDNDEPGRFVPSPQGQLKVSDWKDWDAPTLENDATLSGLE